MSQEKFDALFTSDKPIIADFHGYPGTLMSILTNYAEKSRVKVHGFQDEGSTTTPFEMLRRSAASRYDLAIEVAELRGRDDLLQKYWQIMDEKHAYAVEHGEDAE